MTEVRKTLAKNLAIIVILLSINFQVSCIKSPPLPDSSEPIQFRSIDEKINITAYFPTRKPLYLGIIILPNQKHPYPADWEVLTSKLAQSGLHCVFLEKQDKGSDSQQNHYTPSSLLSESAIDKARKFLVERSIQPENIILVAEGQSASTALNFAITHTEIPAIILLSPENDTQPNEYKNLIQLYGHRASLVLVAENDIHSLQTAAELKDNAKGLCELRVYKGNAKGIDLLYASSQPLEQIMIWLAEILNFSYPPSSQ